MKQSNGNEGVWYYTIIMFFLKISGHLDKYDVSWWWVWVPLLISGACEFLDGIPRKVRKP